MTKAYLYILMLLVLPACKGEEQDGRKEGVELVVLGNVQDAGSPHAGCTRECCIKLWSKPDPSRMVSCLGLLDHLSKEYFLFDATPDLPRQMHISADLCKSESGLPKAIFLSHAHIGHYTGLMYLGREGLDSRHVQVYAMPRMKSFLENNGPWNQLTEIRNIKLRSFIEGISYNYNQRIKVKALRVPHRDEYSETVGYLISGLNKTALFIPDIDKWTRWNLSIDSLISTVNYAFLDGSFYDGNEIVSRDMSEIPHPFVIESMDLLAHLPAAEKNKVYFIHLNHTNPLLDAGSAESQEVSSRGFHVARYLDRFEL